MAPAVPSTARAHLGALCEREDSRRLGDAELHPVGGVHRYPVQLRPPAAGGRGRSGGGGGVGNPPQASSSARRASPREDKVEDGAQSNAQHRHRQPDDAAARPLTERRPANADGESGAGGGDVGGGERLDVALAGGAVAPVDARVVRLVEPLEECRLRLAPWTRR